MSQNSVSERPIRFGVFSSIGAADHAVSQLLAAGFTDEQITVVCSDETREQYFRQFEHQRPAGASTPAAAAIGGAVGAAVGGLTTVAAGPGGCGRKDSGGRGRSWSPGGRKPGPRFSNPGGSGRRTVAAARGVGDSPQRDCVTSGKGKPAMAKKRSDSQSPSVEQGAAPHPSPTAEWSHHEHVTPPMKAQAKKLVDEAGTSDLAKNAIDAASEPDAAAADKDEFARDLGFTSYLDLFEASTRAGSAEGKNWFITALRGGSWVVWNDSDLIASDAFSSPDEARRQLPGNASG